MVAGTSQAGAHRVHSPSGSRRARGYGARPVRILPALALALLGALPSLQAVAQSAAVGALRSRIGFVDIPYLIDRAPQALEAERRLEAEFAPRQAELELQRAELARLTARLTDSSLELDEF